MNLSQIAAALLPIITMYSQHLKPYISLLKSLVQTFKNLGRISIVTFVKKITGNIIFIQLHIYLLGKILF